jgi:hypothetical protein
MNIIAIVKDINVDEDTATDEVSYIVKYLASNGSFSSEITVSSGILKPDAAICKVIRDAVASDAAAKFGSTAAVDDVVVLGAPSRAPLISEGTVHLENTKTAAVVYKDEFGNQTKFDSAPRIGITLLNAASVAPYKVSDSKDVNGKYVGFVVGFSSKVTMDVEWIATERI